MNRISPQRLVLSALPAALLSAVFGVWAAPPLPCPDAQNWTPVHVVGMPYVADARQARVGGVVRLRCLLNAEGAVKDVQVLSGHHILTKSVVENARQWRFVGPGNTTAPNPTALLIYEFKLTGPICGGEYHDGFTFDSPDRVTVTSEYPCFEPDRSGQENEKLRQQGTLPQR
ncbi:MAG: energy transducer TonB [Bryobacteraceae bacterium]